MEHARVARVGVMDRPGDLFDEHGGRARVGLVRLEPIGDGPSFHEFHDEEPAPAVLAEIRRPDDVRMLHPGDRADVLDGAGRPTARSLEAGPRSVLSATTISRVESGTGLPHDPLATFTEFLQKDVIAQHVAGLKIGIARPGLGSDRLPRAACPGRSTAAKEQVEPREVIEVGLEFVGDLGIAAAHSAGRATRRGRSPRGSRRSARLTSISRSFASRVSVPSFNPPGA